MLSIYNIILKEILTGSNTVSYTMLYQNLCLWRRTIQDFQLREFERESHPVAQVARNKKCKMGELGLRSIDLLFNVLPGLESFSQAMCRGNGFEGDEKLGRGRHGEWQKINRDEERKVL